MSKISDPGPEPGPGASPEERDKWRRANERFLTEGSRAGNSQLPATVDATDKRLQELRKDSTKFLEKRSPAAQALWLALLRPTKDILFDVEMTTRYMSALKTGDRDASGYIPPTRSAILEVAQRLVATAVLGDTSAANTIFDRIEGKVGLRAGDEDPDDPARRKQTQEIINATVAELTKGRLEARHGDDAKEIEEIVVSKLDQKPARDYKEPLVSTAKEGDVQ